MSFDLFFVSREVALDKPATHGAADALAVVAAKHGGVAGETFAVKFPDDSWLEFNCDADGGMLSLRRWDEQRAAVIFDILKECGWIAISPQRPLTILSCSDVSDVAPALAGGERHEQCVVGSARELFEALEPSFGGWADYRDQIVKG